MINNPNIEEVKKLVKKEEIPKVILAQDDKFNRKILDYGNFDILLSPEIERKNKLRQIDSGINHVLAKIATKNKISIGIDLDNLKKLDPKNKAERLSKIKQNIEICRKAKTKIAVKIRSLIEAREFLHCLGASTTQLKEAIVF